MSDDDRLRRLLRKPPTGAGPDSPRSGGNAGNGDGVDGDAGDDTHGGGGQPPRHPIAPVWIGRCLRLAGEAYAPTLVLRLRHGKRVALANSYFSSARLESGDLLELDFVGHAISVRGRRLGEVFDAVAAQRALELSESPSHFDEDQTTPFIETIAIVSTEKR
ncbi:MAG: hypothetical protein KF684_08520 [Phycisphaeraceae bacterium]|nr:hypothetical protein [Phycisphaeraceae bacterium]